MTPRSPFSHVASRTLLKAADNIQWPNTAEVRIEYSLSSKKSQFDSAFEDMLRFEQVYVSIKGTMYT